APVPVQTGSHTAGAQRETRKKHPSRTVAFTPLRSRRGRHTREKSSARSPQSPFRNTERISRRYAPPTSPCPRNHPPRRLTAALPAGRRQARGFGVIDDRLGDERDRHAVEAQEQGELQILRPGVRQHAELLQDLSTKRHPRPPQRHGPTQGGAGIIIDLLREG